jgi:hypothetical protein
MGKLDNIESKFDIIDNAPLKNKEIDNKEKKITKNILIYNVPVEWTEILKENGMSFSSYAKIAIFEKMKRDGLL